MSSNRFLAAVAAFALLCPLGAIAQEKEGGFDFGLSIGIGADTFYEEGVNVTYQKVTLSPDIAFGKFGIGLELAIHYTFTGGAEGNDFFIRTEGEWVPGADQNFLDVYLPKFKYVRYGFKGEPLYAKLGSIEDGTLGNGFIMANYDNTLFLPEKRIFGLAFDLDGALFDFPYVGIESFVGNLSRFDVIGGRLFVRPLAFTTIPIIKNLQVGGTLAMDTDPGLHTGDPGLETVVLYGVDLRQPILASKAISLAVFGDLAILGNRGSLGGMVGLGGRIAGFLLYGAQIRMLGDNFVPVYFDSTYDLFREDKWKIATGQENVPAYTGWLGSLGFAFFEDLLVFNASLDGPFESDRDTLNYLDWPHLYAQFVLGKGLIPNISLEASFDKRYLGKSLPDEPLRGFFRDLFSFADAVIQARLNYSIGAAVLSLVYDIRWDPSLGDWVTHSGIESAIELF